MLWFSFVNSLIGRISPLLISGSAALYSSCTISANGSPANTLFVKFGTISSNGTVTNSIFTLYFFSTSSIFAKRLISDCVVPAGVRSHQAAILMTRPPRSYVSSSTVSDGSGVAVSSLTGDGDGVGVAFPELLFPPLQADRTTMKQINKNENPFNLRIF